MKTILKHFSLLIVLLSLTFSLIGCTRDEHRTDMATLSSRQNLLSIMKNFRSRDRGIVEFSAESFTMDDAATENTTKSGGSDDYSETNTQVAGVDEADVVKTDGEFIYSISQYRVLVTKAYPHSEAAYVKELEFDEGFAASSLYVDENYLIVIGNQYKEAKEGENYYYWYSHSDVKVYIYQKSDLDTPEDILEFDGYQVSSRKVNNELILIMNKYVYNYKEEEKVEDEKILPNYSLNGSKTMINYDEVYYKDGTNPNGFVSVYKVNIDDPENTLEHFTYLGRSDKVYVSSDNIYVAQNLYRFRIGILEGIMGSSTDEEETKTYITKVNFEDGLVVKGNTTVKGFVRNQFSMDEYNGDFRITTTRGNTWDETSTNNLYIYDENLSLISSIEGLAEGESIQSTRFVGDRIYMVTFRQIDPFFVIDASDPKKPILLGELKIPGFSTYLHPYDENHVIGFGFEANTNGGRTGIKMALYDVTDPTKPVEKFKHTMLYNDLGWSSSEITYDHKSLLFSKDKNIIAFPFSSTQSEVITFEEDGQMVTRREHTYKQEYKVFGLDLEHGFTEKASITHFAQGRRYDYSYLDRIQRGLYIDDYLYTVSQSKIMIHDLDQFQKVKEIDFPIEEQPHHYFGYHYWID